MKRITIEIEVPDEEAEVVAERIDDLLPEDYRITTVDVTYWIHKVTVHQTYGGPEEGGWWYDSQAAIDPEDRDYMPPVPFTEKEAAYAACRELNAAEYERRSKENEYGYTSVLSYRETFYQFTIEESNVFTPEPRPHYE